MKRLTIITILISIVCTASSIASPVQLRLDKYAGQPQQMTNVQIASISVFPEKWNKETNWTRIEKMVRRAVSDAGPDVVVTPEGALEGYVINEVGGEKDEQKRARLTEKFLQLAEPIDGPYLQKASDLCDELDVYLVLGFLERRGESLYNTAALIDPDGDMIGRYSKTHFAQGYERDPDCYRAGDEYPVFDTPFGKVGMLICYDRQLPEPARILALKGAQILFLPSYGSYTDRDGWNTILLRTRAYENRMPLIFSHPNQSILIQRSGEITAMCESGEIACYEVNTSPDRYEGRFKNRRPPTYLPLTEGADPAKE